jgi:hypothetical protein
MSTVSKLVSECELVLSAAPSTALLSAIRLPISPCSFDHCQRAPLIVMLEIFARLNEFVFLPMTAAR